VVVWVAAVREAVAVGLAVGGHPGMSHVGVGLGVGGVGVGVSVGGAVVGGSGVGSCVGDGVTWGDLVGLPDSDSDWVGVGFFVGFGGSVGW
jgi:hypothetical protein